jgi:hypothetical protein
MLRADIVNALKTVTQAFEDSGVFQLSKDLFSQGKNLKLMRFYTFFKSSCI